MASKRRCRIPTCSRGTRRTTSNGSTSTATSGRFSTSSLMRASNFTVPTMPTLRPNLRNVARAGEQRGRNGEFERLRGLCNAGKAKRGCRLGADRNHEGRNALYRRARNALRGTTVFMQPHFPSLLFRLLEDEKAISLYDEALLD